MVDELITVLHGGPKHVQGLQDAVGHGPYLGVDPADELLAVAQEGGGGFQGNFQPDAHHRADLLTEPREGPFRHLGRDVHTPEEPLTSGL